MDTPKFPGFDILEKMPQGSMGTVYKARQLSLDRLVALKMLPPALATDSADVDQFLLEARIAAKLKHQNIVQIYDFGKSEEGIYYFVMEFVSGYSIADWIKRKKSLSEENSLLIAQSVADALGYAWAKARVIHCDIKSDNIMIDGDGSVKVADLGLAKSVGSVMDKSKVATGIVFGTPNYISPEQSRGDVEQDCRTDIYSLGATLYHCMTGKMPFEGLPAVKVMDMQITDQVPDPQDVNPYISIEAACLIEKMMAKDKEQRQRDWKSVLEDISQVKNNQMPLGELPEPGASTIKRSARRGTYPRLKVKKPVITDIPKSPAPSGVPIESSNFIEMERKFEKKQKRLLLNIKPEWWFAGVITVAVLVLGALILKGRLTKIAIQPLSTTERKAEPVAGPDKSVDKGLPVTIGVQMTRDNDAREMFNFAMQWFKKHNDHYDEAIQNFTKVGLETSGTKYSLMASAEIQKIRYLKRKAVEGILDSLREQAEAMAKENNYVAAAELYEQYRDTMAKETESLRQLRAKEWREREERFKEQLRVANQQWLSLIENVVADLVNADPEAALARVSQAVKSTPLSIKKNELNDLHVLLTDASQMEQRILHSFLAQKGKEVKVSFSKGSDKLLIRNVTEGHVEGEKIIVLGAGHVSHPISFKVSDLALAEKMRRLGSDEQPEIALMNGILLVQAGDFKSAGSFFGKVGSPLSVHLVESLNKKQKLQTEENAAQTLSWLMRSVKIDIPENIPCCDDCLTAIRKKVFTKKDAQMLAKAIETYRKKYGHTEFAREYEPVLTRLSAVPLTMISPRRKLPSKAVTMRKSIRDKRAGDDRLSRTPGKPGDALSEFDPDVVRAKFMERNPGLNNDQIMFKPDSSGRIVGVVIISPDLKDIQPLASFPHLREVICSAMRPLKWFREPKTAPLKDISVLKGMSSLREVNFSHTMVRDISVLADMPLTKVNLASTKLNDLMFLQGMPLTELDVSNTQIRDIQVLKGMPLKQLVVAKTRVRDISMLKGMQLRFLDINGTEVKDLSPLKGMPLKHLRAGNTRLSDFTPLVGMPLRHLSIAGTDIRDLSVLTTLPLKDLNIGATKIKDLKQIQGLQLERLVIKSTAVKDLSPLAAMPLKYLNIRQTNVKDLTPIQNSTIEEIYLDYNPFEHRKGTHDAFISVLQRMPCLRLVNGQSL